MSGGITVSTQPELLIQRIEDLIRRRSSSDRRMGYVWMIVPILPIFVGIAIAVSIIGILVSAISKVGSLQQPQNAAPIVGEILGLYGFAIMSLYLVLLVGSFALYYLIDRRNAHFKRQQQLFSLLPTYLSSREKPPRAESKYQLTQLSEDSVLEERDRPAGLWAVLYLFVTPIVGLIVAYSLTQDLRKHENLQSAYQTSLVGAFNEAGIQLPTFSPDRAHKRDPILLIILTAITAGLFWIYWFYTLLKDYNEHFQDQTRFEDQILASLKPQPATKPCATCGGAVPETARFCPNCGRPRSS